jgi:low affinity Fe/Cu permease
VGAHFSSRSADRYIRPVLVAVLVISSLGLLGVSNGWLLTTAIAAIVILMVVFVRMRHNAQPSVGARAPAKAA